MPAPFRIPAEAQEATKIVRAALRQRGPLLFGRQSQAGASPQPTGTSSPSGLNVAGVVVLGIVAATATLVAAVVAYRMVLARRRRNGHIYRQTGAADDEAANPLSGSNRMRETSGAANSSHRRAESTTASTTAGVDRNTSVRSVMTLPVYRAKATDNEQVLGREGERDGIDVVVELPTAEEEEALRDDEMEALYQIRRARRQQLAEREQRRVERREARERHDYVALEELRARTAAARDENPAAIEELRREHERIKETRQRAVSSVSYADVGVARADGTRIRANSTESERVGLLSDAASISARSRASSLLHRRDRSASSVMSIDTARSNTLGDRPDSPGSVLTGNSMYTLGSARGQRSRANSGAGTPRGISRSTTPRAGSSPEIIDAEEGDMGESGMPPPGYDEVSLDDITPSHSPHIGSASGRNSPYAEPPPGYPGGPSQARNHRLSAHMEDLAAEAGYSASPTTMSIVTDDDGQSMRSGRSGHPRLSSLPSLRLSRVPTINIEPASARPREYDH